MASGAAAGPGALRTKLTVPRLWPGALPRSTLVDYLTAAGVPGG